MPQTLPTLSRQLLLILLALFGAGQVSALAEDDPLIGLIDGLRGDRTEPVETWLQVLSEQVPNTVTTLVKVLREDRETELLGKLEPQLREVIIQATLQHTSGPQDPVTWEQHCRVSMEIVGVLGESPEARNLLLLLKSPKGAPTGTYNVRPFQRALRDSLLQACDRDESTLRVIQRVYGTQTRALDSQLLRILGDCDAPSTPDTLARCLGKRRNFDGIVLTQIAGALRKPHLRITEFALGSVRPLLEDSTPLTRQSAARALGYADDTESIRPLILLLKDPSDSVRNETLKALHRITAMTIEGHPDRWLIWFDEETHWWINDAATTLQSLRDSTQKDVAKILRVLAGKRLFRRELAPHVMELLDDPRPEVVRLALATLESLRPPLKDLAPRLRELSNHRSPVVRNDAARILSYLTTRKSPAVPARSVVSSR